MTNKKGTAILLALFVLSTISCQKDTTNVRRVKFNIEPVEIYPKPEKVLEAWSYDNTVPGQPIVANVGETLIVEGRNNLDKLTTIHWHGLAPIPVSEDGPFKPIPAGKKFRFEFPLLKSGTYWYHSHTRPVVEQVNRGLYAPFIVKAPEDDLYDGDHVIMLSDMLLGEDKAWQEGLGVGLIERIGNTIAVNGLIEEAIQPLNVKPGEIHKLRFIGAGTAAYFQLNSPIALNVTHTDGQGVERPYQTTQLVIGPGERYDVELLIPTEIQDVFSLQIVDSIYPPITKYPVSAKIPLIASGDLQAGRVSLYQPQPKSDVSAWLRKEPDFTLALSSNMMQGNHDHAAMLQQMQNMGHAGHGMMSEDNMSGTQWYINGETFPNVPPATGKVGQPIKIRFVNNDNHPMDHPMHLHGASFRVLSINGQPPAQGGQLDKDVINVPKNGGIVDILVQLERPGTWMLHCHILDHEDNGMMMVVEIKE
ncbi:MAG: multicopper oxidase family protein [Spirochaetia bacterium]